MTAALLAITVPLVSLLIGIIVFALIVVVVKMVLETLRVDWTIQRLVYLLLAVLFVLWLIGELTGYGGGAIFVR